MNIDLENIKIVVAILVGILTVLGTIFGWFSKVWVWVTSLIKERPQEGIIEIPAKTMVLIPVARSNALWWHMGSSGEQPAMQIVGDLNITNISKYDVHVMGAKLKKPKAIGHAVVRAQGDNIYSSKNIIPKGAVSDLRFDFWVQPPVLEKDKTFKADIAIIDQFGNEHWLKGLRFLYL